ncbi:MAG: NAD-dependent DNA ligase LigA, partial [Vampirovibrionales bacterium]|nr:NAD-dependent DNA ligase LigA [Vampirovibrionales bacterium]
MLSLQKAYQISEIEAWIQSVRELGKLSASTPLVLVVEPKWDGLAVACHYRHGHLVAGAIRGDGQQGQLVTANLGTIQSLPVELTKQNSIPQLFEVRGEVVMSRAQFDALNETLEKQHKPLFSTPRNAATGSLRQKNPQVTADRKLDFIAYSGLLSEAPREDFSSHWQILEQLAQWGFQVSAPRVRCENIDCVKAFIDKWSSERKTFPIETDGVVIKVDSLALQHQLGATAKTPRWAIAYKYTPQQAETVVETIDYSRSSSGRLTPIAVVSPVMINGTTIRRVNLHSLEEMARLDVRVGDTVVIHKAGEIIPQIVDVVKTKRHPRKRPEPIPKQ